MLLDTVYKALAISGYVQSILGDWQYGFITNRSVVDQIFALRQLQASHYEYRLHLYLLFIDCMQPYDTIK